MDKSQRGIAHLVILAAVATTLIVIIVAVVAIVGKRTTVPEKTSRVATQGATIENPFDTYKNPFEKPGYTNPFSQFTK